MLVCRVGLFLAATTSMMLFKTVISSKEAMISINSMKWLHLVHDRFLSLTLHPRHLLSADKFGIESTKMARGLAPAFVRVGGPESDLLQFTNSPQEDEKISVSESQWKRLNAFVTDSSLDLIVCLNPLQRVNGVWDSRSTLELISMSNRNGYNLTWQLGFESQKLRNHDEGISGAELGRDIVRLRKILDSFPRYKESEIIGPDITSIKSYEDVKFIKDYLMESGNALSAITWHPKFADANAEGEDVLKSLSIVYNGLDALLYGKDQIPKASQYVTEKPMWIAESQSHCYGGEFSDALIWIRRLGTAARLGFYVFMHHIQESGFNQPTPDFWVSLLYKNLVGRAVLDTRIISGNRSTLQIFSHCTAVEEIPINPIIAEGFEYERGSVTLFGSNSLNEQVKISLTSLVRNEKVHIYVLSGGGAARPRTTLLNGQELTLSPSGDLPIILPKIRTTNRNFVYAIPPRSVFFIVLPEARVRTCTTYPGTIVLENNNIMKRLNQGKSSTTDIQDNIENIPMKDENNEFRSSELSANEIYVKFIDTNSEGIPNVNSVRPIRGRSNGVNAGQKFNVGKSKTNILKNKYNKYSNRNNELRETNEKSPKQEDTALDNVKYVTYSESSWLPKLFETNYNQETSEDIIKKLNNTFNGLIEPKNSTMKTSPNQELNERREKYTVLANAIFGKRNLSSEEIKDISGLRTDLKNRYKRYIENEEFFATQKPPYLIYNYNPTGLKSDHISKENRNKLDKSLPNNLESDGRRSAFRMENQYAYPQEGNTFDFVNEAPTDNKSKDMHQKNADFPVDEINQENGYYLGEFSTNLNSQPKVNSNVVKNVLELSEVELDVISRNSGNKIKLPEEDEVYIEIVTEKCCNNTHDKQVKKIVSQQLPTYYITLNDKNLHEISNYDANKNSQVRKKEKAILTSILNKETTAMDSTPHKIQTAEWDSDTSLISIETPRVSYQDYNNPNYYNNIYKSTGRIRRTTNEGKEKDHDGLEDISTKNSENEKNYLEKSEEDQLTQILKQITDDGEKILNVLVNERKELEQQENNFTTTDTMKDQLLENTDITLANSSTENSLFTDVPYTNIVPEFNTVTVEYNQDNKYEIKPYESSSSPTSVIVNNNAIVKKAVFSEIKREDTNFNDEENLKEELKSLNENVSVENTTNGDVIDQRKPRNMFYDLINNKKNNTIRKSSRIIQHSHEDEDNTEKPSDEIQNMDLERNKNKDTNANFETKMTDEKNLNTTTSPLIYDTLKEIPSNKEEFVEETSTTEITTVSANQSKWTESESNTTSEPENTVTETPTTELTTPKNNTTLSIIKNQIKPKSLKLTQEIRNNYIRTNKNETLKKQQLLQDRASRPKRRNEQIELLRSRLVAYRQHINELTKKQLRHKREVDINYSSKNRIFKKDNPFEFENALNNLEKQVEASHHFSSAKPIKPNRELDTIVEPKVQEKSIAHEDSLDMYTDIPKYTNYISKNKIDTLQSNVISKPDLRSNNYGYNNRKYVLSAENVYPLKQNMDQQYKKINIINVDAQTGQLNKRHLLQNVKIESDVGEASKLNFRSKDQTRSKRSSKSEIDKKISPRHEKFSYSHKNLPTLNNNELKTRIKVNKKISEHKRSIDDYEMNSIENSINYMLSTNAIPKNTPTAYNPSMRYNKKIQKNDKMLYDSGVSKIKKIAGQYKKAEANSVNRLLGDYTPRDTQNKHTHTWTDKNDLTASNVQSQNVYENKRDNINKTVTNNYKNVTENQTTEQCNKMFSDFIKNAFTYFINQIRNMFKQ